MKRPFTNSGQLTALMIAPNRALAQEFSQILQQVPTFQIVADLKSYPPLQTLDIRLRQLKPDVVLLDLSSELDAAGELIRFVASVRPVIHVIGLHQENDPQALVKSLRMGATEFLHSPFEIEAHQEAFHRIRRLRQPEGAAEQGVGNVVVFSSAKPGAGASTLAAQTAFGLKQATGQRVLLMDLDLSGGTIGFYLKVDHPTSTLDALRNAAAMDAGAWASLTAVCLGVDVLPAPETPFTAAVETSRLHDVLESARQIYDWVVVDVPSIFHRISLLALSESDQALLVTTPELPSLHLTRKAVSLLGNLGIGRERFQVAVNRVSKRDGITGSDIGKIFGCPIFATFPNDYFSLHRVVALGQPLGTDCDLGKAIFSLAGRLGGTRAGGHGRGEETPAPKPVYSGT